MRISYERNQTADLRGLGDIRFYLLEGALWGQAGIKKYLEWIKNDVELHNGWIASQARKYVITRKKALQRDSDFLKSLGLPLRTKQTEESITSVKIAQESTKENKGKSKQ